VPNLPQDGEEAAAGGAAGSLVAVCAVEPPKEPGSADPIVVAASAHFANFAFLTTEGFRPKY